MCTPDFRGAGAPRAIRFGGGAAILATTSVLATAAWLALGGALAAAVEAMSAIGGEPPRTAARYWAADRDARRVVGLDENLFVVASLPADWPVRLEARGDGGLWVARAASGDPTGPHVLERWSSAGAVLASVPLGPLYDLACIDGGEALAVAGTATGTRDALIAAGDGTWRACDAPADVLSVAGRGGQWLLGTESGALELRDVLDPTLVLAQRQLGGIVSDVAPGPRRGSWWALDASGSPSHRRIVFLEPDLTTSWERVVGLAAHSLAPVPGEERVWVVDATAPLARRFGPGGTLEIAGAQLALAGAERARALAGGGALFPAAGALLRLDAQGIAAPGQGGFDFLVDVAAR
jgi:hypothetical protein